MEKSEIILSISPAAASSDFKKESLTRSLFGVILNLTLVYWSLRKSRLKKWQSQYAQMWQKALAALLFIWTA